MDQDNKRTIRSFVRRGGRMTTGQTEALAQYWTQFGLTTTQGQINFFEIFARSSDVILEIGFGMGESLSIMAARHPELDYIAVDVHKPGVGALLQQIVKKQLNNIRIFHEDVMDVLNVSIADESLSGVQIFFPDPWSKLRHHKRRLIQPAFIEILWRKLKIGGTIHMATDWENYAEHMLAVMNEAAGFNNVAGHAHFIENKNLRPSTKFEQRGLRLGHKVWDLLFFKI